MPPYKSRLNYLMLISIGMYCSSWFCPVFIFNNSNMPGWFCVLIGLPFSWMIGHFEVFANFFFLAALLAYGTREFRYGIITSGISVLLAMQTFTLSSIPGTGPSASISGYGPGFYLWLLSMIIILLISWMRERCVDNPNLS